MADRIGVDVSERICSIEGCDKPENARRLCKGHYYRWSRYGDPTASAPPRPPRPPKVRDCCSVTGCDSPQYARGWCENHYARWRRHGALHDKRAQRTDPEVRFWAKVDQSDPDGCWLWTGGLNNSGYGVFQRSTNQPIGAHVMAVLLDGRDVPPGMEPDHLCAVRHCVRPDHLDVVTHAENTRRARERAMTKAW